MSDKLGRKVYCLGLDGKAKVVAEMPGQPTGLGFLPDGILLVASAVDQRIMRLETDQLVCHVDLSSIAAGEISNMIVDRHGRAYVTSFCFEASPSQSFTTARVILVTAEGKAHVVVDNLVRPRGIALTGSRQLLIAETFANRLTAFQIVDDGSLSQRRLFANFEQISPEGICLDAEGRSGLQLLISRCLFVCSREAASLTVSMFLAARRWHANSVVATAGLSSA